MTFLAEVAQLTAIAALMFEVEGDAGVERLGVDVEADAACRSCVFNLVDRLQLVDRNHTCAFGAADGAQLIQLNFGRSAEAVDIDDVLVLGGIAAFVMVLVGEDLALRDGHPAKLSVMRVDGGLLAGRPT